MSFTDLIVSRFTFGPCLNDPQPVTSSGLSSWLAAQLLAPVSDDLVRVVTRLNYVLLPISITATDGTSKTTTRGLTDLFKSSQDLWAILAADTSANRAESRRPADEVAAARWIRAAFSPWQIQEVMVDFWHNHFSVDAYKVNQISAMWPAYDNVIRANALGNFRTMLGATAKSAAMMYYLNQNASVASHPNENFAREVMELHTLGIGRYLGETTPPGTAGTGYSDQDVINAARVLTGWTIADGSQKNASGLKPNTGDFLFSPSTHDNGSKVILGQTYPAAPVQPQYDGETFLNTLANHPGTALTIATKLYTHFVRDVPPANNPLVQTMASVFQQNVNAPDQIARVLNTLIASTEFADSAGQKVKTPFEFLISVIRATGAEINPQPNLTNMLSAMGAPMFRWPTPNGMPDIAPIWTGTNDMIQRWSLADQVMSSSLGILLDGPTTLFAQLAPAIKTPPDAAYNVAQSILGPTATTTSLNAMATYAASGEVLGASGAVANPSKLNAGLRRLAGAAAATPEFQIR